MTREDGSPLPSEGSDDPTDPALDGARLTPGELQDRAIRGAVWTLLHTVVSLPLAFVVNILIARVLGVVDYGRLAYLTAVITLVGSVISLGVGTGVIQFGAKAHAAGRTEDVQRLLSASQGFRLLVTMPVMIAVVIGIADVAPWLVWLAVVFGVVVPTFFGGAPACFGIENKTAQGAQNAMIVNVLTQAAVVATVVTIPSADAIWATRLAMGGIAVVMALPYVSRRYRRAVLMPRLPRGFPPGFWRFAIPAGAAGLVGSLVASRSEVVVLTWMSAVEAAGVFALAFGLINHLFGPAQALLGPLVPAVAGLREVDESAVGRALERTLRASSTVVGLLVGAAVPAFAFLVVPIYGDEYLQVPGVLVALGVAGGFSVVAGPVQAFVQARLSGGKLLWVNLAAVAVDVALMILLVPQLGVWGAVAGNAGAILTQLVLFLAGELRLVGLSWARAGRSVFPLVLGVMASMTAWFGASAVGWSGVLGALMAGLWGAVVMVVGVRVTRTGLTPADADVILRVLPRTARRMASPLVGLMVRAQPDCEG